MPKKVPGKNGLEVSAIGLGCMTVGKEELNEIAKILDGITIAGERYDPNSENGQSVRR